MRGKGFIVGGASSGSGKTTLTMGLLKALTNRGYKVQPFKVGPDYIDPMFHTYISHQKSYNLSASLVDDVWLQTLFYKHIETADIAVIEGVMGYYDGADVKSIAGSTAHIANLLNVDALVVFDASSMALSAAAIVSGFAHFMGHKHLKGVIFNNVKSEHHYTLLKTAVETHTSVKAYGYLPPMPDLALKSRHLGLVQAVEVDQLSYKIERLADQIEETVDVSLLIEDFEFEKTRTGEMDKAYAAYLNFTGKWQSIIKEKGRLRLALAYDEAFSFYYEDNLELLEACGIDLIRFSPMRDKSLPANIDGLYLGGGYPEVFAEALSNNKDLLNEIQEALEGGLPAYAECGGLMYLTRQIETLDGKCYPMVDFFDVDTRMTKRLQRFGYVDLKVSLPPYQESIIKMKAHEFHKSISIENCNYDKAYKVAKNGRNWTGGLVYKTCLAGYPHIHFFSHFDFLDSLLKHLVK